jgi:hypothetical protein
MSSRAAWTEEGVRSQPGLYSETLLQTNKQTNRTHDERCRLLISTVPAYTGCSINGGMINSALMTLKGLGLSYFLAPRKTQLEQGRAGI